jgi:RimJ/RimL family protein N-acetyltransferase
MAIRHQGRAVGAVTLSPGTGRAAYRAELGYVVARAHWKKGYASAASREALKRGFTDLGIERIEAFVDPANPSSIKVLENAGLHREGLLPKYVIHRGEIRDRLIYAAVRT